MNHLKKKFRGIALGLCGLLAAATFTACGTGTGAEPVSQLPDATEMSWRSADGTSVYTEDNLA